MRNYPQMMSAATATGTYKAAASNRYTASRVAGQSIGGYYRKDGLWFMPYAH